MLLERMTISLLGKGSSARYKRCVTLRVCHDGRPRINPVWVQYGGGEDYQPAN